MKFMITVLFLSFAITTVASEKYMMICRGNEINFSLRREIKLDGEIYGWKKYWGRVDYKVPNKLGTLDAQILWRKDSRPGYNALIITLMDKNEAEFRKKGVEGGLEGFGAIDSREEIKENFKAKWTTYKDSEDAPELQSDVVALDCEMQK